MASAMKMVHDVDPADEIRRQVGDLRKIDVFANQVLLGVYKRPEKTKSGIILSDRTRDEDEHQGKVGLVLKLGPQAYVDSDDYTFTDEEKVEVGDWVAMWVTDGRKITINEQLCRVVKDVEVRMRVPTPDVVF